MVTKSNIKTAIVLTILLTVICYTLIPLAMSHDLRERLVMDNDKAVVSNYNANNDYLLHDYTSELFLTALTQKNKDNTLNLTTADARELYDNEKANAAENTDDKSTEEMKLYRTKITEAQASGDTKRAKSLRSEFDAMIKTQYDYYFDDKKILAWANTKLLANLKEGRPSLAGSKEELDDTYYYYIFDTASKEILTNIPTIKASSSKADVQMELERLGANENKEIIQTRTVKINLKDELNNESINLYKAPSAEYQTIFADKDLLANYSTYVKEVGQTKMITWLYVISGGLALIVLGWLVAKKQTLKIAPLFNLPLDIALIGVLFSGGLLLVIYRSTTAYELTPLILSGILMAIIVISSPRLYQAYRSETVRNELKSGVIGKWLENYQRLSLMMHVFCLIVMMCMSGALGLLIATQESPYVGLFVFSVLALLSLIMHMVYYHRVRETMKRPATIIQAATGEAIMQVSNKTVAEVNVDYERLEQLINQKIQKSEKSESLKTDLITNVSHDLRTPLTSIVTYSDLMQQPNVTLADQAAYAEVIQRKAQRMKQLIDDLFEVTKMDNGAIELNYTEVDLVALVKQSVGEYTEEFNSSSYLLRTTYPEQPIMVTIDSDKIWRVIDNLLQNTLKYTLPQSRIYVTVQDEMNQSRIIIKNISNYELNEAAPLLIERFKRGEQEKARDTEGHGLGLAIVQSIVSLHQGQLIVTVDGDMFKVQVVLPHKAAQESQFGL